jgi:hypothetical protein
MLELTSSCVTTCASDPDLVAASLRTDSAKHHSWRVFPQPTPTLLTDRADVLNAPKLYSLPHHSMRLPRSACRFCPFRCCQLGYSKHGSIIFYRNDAARSALVALALLSSALMTDLFSSLVHTGKSLVCKVEQMSLTMQPQLSPTNRGCRPPR